VIACTKPRGSYLPIRRREAIERSFLQEYKSFENSLFIVQANLPLWGRTSTERADQDKLRLNFPLIYSLSFKEVGNHRDSRKGIRLTTTKAVTTELVTRYSRISTWREEFYRAFCAPCCSSPPSQPMRTHLSVLSGNNIICDEVHTVLPLTTSFRERMPQSSIFFRFINPLNEKKRDHAPERYF
jgi:hypothetical protein